MMRRGWLIVLLWLGGAPGWARAADIFADPVIARGDGFEVKRSQLDDALTVYQTTLATTGDTIPEDQRVEVRANLLQSIIQMDILMGKASPGEKAKAREMADRLFLETKKQFGEDDLFNFRLKAKGMSVEQFRNRLYEQNLCELVLQREFKSKIVSVENAKKFEEPAPPLSRVRQILIFTVDPVTGKALPPEEKQQKLRIIQSLKTRAGKGEDFATLARKYSQDPNVKENNGEYTFGKGRMPREFEAAVASLKVNEVSGVVETPYGYHLIQRLEEKANPLPPLLDQGLIEREFSAELPRYLEKIEKEANVQIAAQSPQ